MNNQCHIFEEKLPVHKQYFTLACLTAALAVGLGAFGAHGLEGFLTENKLASFDTGVRYQFIHSIALLVLSIIYDKLPAPHLGLWAARLFIIGMLFFCGSLYLLTTCPLWGAGPWWWLGPITPLGGLAFIGAWILLGSSVWRSKNDSV